MKINWKTGLAFLIGVLVIAALAAWGDYLHMSAGALTWVRAIAGMIGMAIVTAMPALLADKDGDGVPDVLETKIPQTNPPTKAP